MRKRNVVLSGVLRGQARIRKLQRDLKRRKNDDSFLSAAAREKVMDQIDQLKEQLK
jgi:hypothetical protein